MEAANVPAVCGVVMRLCSDGVPGVVIPAFVDAGVATEPAGAAAVLSMLRAPPLDPPPAVVAIRLPPSYRTPFGGVSHALGVGSA